MLTDRVNHIPGRGTGGIGTSGPENTKTHTITGVAGNVATPAPTQANTSKPKIVARRSARPSSRPFRPGKE